MSDYALGPIEIAIIPLDAGIGDSSTVRVCLDGEADCHYISLKQYDNEVTLDFEEIPLLVEAVASLQASIDKKADEPGDDYDELAEDDEDVMPVAKEQKERKEQEDWAEPDEDFLLAINPQEALALIVEPFDAGDYHLLRVFTWGDSPQGARYWRSINNGLKPFGQEQKDILRGFLAKRSSLIAAQKKDKEKEEAEKKEEKKSGKWPMPSDRFLLALRVEDILEILVNPPHVNGMLSHAFTWSSSPQGHDYWSALRHSAVPLHEESLGILRSWLSARFALDEK
jgi:hypothetical protein